MCTKKKGVNIVKDDIVFFFSLPCVGGDNQRCAEKLDKVMCY